MSTDELFNSKDNPFKSHLRGSFGSVKTNTSYELNFILSSLPISRIDELETASDALDVQMARFSDLLQRDIDFERVEKIVNGYLQRGDHRVVFFPPLLVSVVALEDPGAIGQTTQLSDQYDQIEDTNEGVWLIRTWDRNRFMLQLHSADPDTGVPFRHNNTQRSVHPYGCFLKWNPRVVKLVIIDGQHRLCALKTLHNDVERRHVIEHMQIPICVVFPPAAIAGNTRGETIPAVLRDLFVTINQTAKEVSGHFLVLLNDKSLSALAVRELAESWKSHTLEPNLTKLHLLEWNQRLKSRSNQTEKKYSITTVSIIADVLERSLFEAKSGGLTNTFLNLTERRLELEREDAWTRIDSISNQEFHPAQQDILREQIAQYLTPALDILFSMPSPFARKLQKLVHAKKWLDTKVAQMASGADLYRDRCLKHFRRWTPLDDITARPIEATFEEMCAHEEPDAPYFLNVFQQGMLRAWIDISRLALPYELAPAHTASAFVVALEELCYARGKAYFSSDQSYTRLSLYRYGGAVIVTEGSREQWKRLILATFLVPVCIQRFRDALSSYLSPSRLQDLLDELRELARVSHSDFLEDVETAMQRDFEKNWKDREVTAQQQENIRSIVREHGDTSDEFKELISQKLTKPAMQKIRQRLDSILEATPAI